MASILTSQGGLGFVLVIVLAACIDPNIENVLGSVYGQPVRSPPAAPSCDYH